MKIDFVEPYRPSRRMWTFALAPWALAAVLWAIHLQLQAHIEQQHRTLLAQEEAAQRAAAAPAPPAPPPPYLKDAQEALKRAAQPEADALKELETVAVIGIQLRSIDVNPAVSAVTVELEASDDKVLGDYLDQLNAGMAKPLWHIQRISSLKAPSAVRGATSPGTAQPELTRAATITREL